MNNLVSISAFILSTAAENTLHGNEASDEIDQNKTKYLWRTGEKKAKKAMHFVFLFGLLLVFSLLFNVVVI